MYLNNITYELEQYVNPNPVMTIGGVSIINAMSPKNITERVMRITAGSGFGFVDVSTSKKWFMRISNKLDYEIIFINEYDTIQEAYELEQRILRLNNMHRITVDYNNFYTTEKYNIKIIKEINEINRNNN